MSDPHWQLADTPAVLLNLLEQAGEQRRLRLLACVFLRGIRDSIGRRMLLARARLDETATGWPAILHCAEQLADDPGNAAALALLRRIRTELAIDCQALARLMMQRMATPPAEFADGARPPIALLPRLLLIAAGSQFLLPPSPLALAALDPERFGELLPIEVAELPPDHPRGPAERRLALVLDVVTDPFAAVTAMLDGLVALEVPMLLAADGSSGPEPNLQSVLGDLGRQSAEEMSSVLQAARDQGNDEVYTLMLHWTQGLGLIDPGVQIAGSPGFVQAWGLAFLAAGLTCLEDATPTLAGFRNAEHGLVRIIRAVAGNPYRQPRLDATWIHRDDQRVGKLAEGIYQDRRWADLPILGDALEDAGCADRAILDALRETAVPCRGWWLLDALRIGE